MDDRIIESGLPNFLIIKLPRTVVMNKLRQRRFRSLVLLELAFEPDAGWGMASQFSVLGCEQMLNYV
jgi:hypothetical protein